ncbi:IS3 family transposase [bacterium]|nr:IS3 family transposase [bacterium]
MALHLAEKSQLPLSVVCQTLEISRSAAYAWKLRHDQPACASDTLLSSSVGRIFRQHCRRYGTRRIAKDLESLGIECGRQRIRKIMKTQGLVAIQPKSFKPRSTESRHLLGYNPNLLLEASGPTMINQLWVTDITYVPMEGGSFCYLAIVMDLFSRRIVGWQLQQDMTESLVLEALRKAIRARQPSPGLLHHSDRGGQYAGKVYRATLMRAGIKQSMSRAGNVYDNNFMESCFGTIKTELEMVEYQKKEQAEREIATYVAYYNGDRRHSSLGYLTPSKFEQQQACRK